MKSEIAKKMDANGVKSYSLDIVEKDKDAQGKVVAPAGWHEEDYLQPGHG